MKMKKLQIGLLYEQRNRGDYLRYKGKFGELYKFELVTLDDLGHVKVLATDEWLDETEVSHLMEA